MSVAEFRIINKSHNTNQKYYCATLNGKKVHFVQRSLSTYKCINESIGNKCQIHCEELSQYFDNVCNKSIICNAFTNGNSKCFCPVWTKEILCKGKCTYAKIRYTKKMINPLIRYYDKKCSK